MARLQVAIGVPNDSTDQSLSDITTSTKTYVPNSTDTEDDEGEWAASNRALDIALARLENYEHNNDSTDAFFQQQNARWAFFEAQNKKAQNKEKEKWNIVGGAAVTDSRLHQILRLESDPNPTLLPKSLTIHTVLCRWMKI